MSGLFFSLFLHPFFSSFSIYDTDSCYIFQAVLETVAKITHEKAKKNDSQEAKYECITCF